MIEIILNQEASNFDVRFSYKEFEADSADGRRRGYAYTVHTRREYHFFNPRRKGRHFVYDLQILFQTDQSVNISDQTASLDKFKRNFHTIYTDLRKKGLEMLNFPAYMLVQGSYRPLIFVEDGAQAEVSLDFRGQIYPLEPQDKAISAPYLIRLITRSKESLIARTINDETFYHRQFKVSMKSLPPQSELYGRFKVIRLAETNLTELLKKQTIEDHDVIHALDNLAQRFEQTSSFFFLSWADGLERFIAELPTETQEIVLRKCPQNVSA